MGKMKELFMKLNYKEEIDIEREYLINDNLAKDAEYEEFLRLQNSSEINSPLNTKIEISNGRSKIEIGKKEQVYNGEAQRA